MAKLFTLGCSEGFDWVKHPDKPIWYATYTASALRMHVLWRERSPQGSLTEDIKPWTTSSTPTIDSVVAGGYQAGTTFDGFAFTAKGAPIHGDGGADDMGYVVYREAPSDGQKSWEFGTGQPAKGGSSPYDAGLTGVVPLIVNKKDFKSHRRVTSGGRGGWPGRTILARFGSDQSGTSIGVFVQEHNSMGGLDLHEWVDVLVEHGATDAMNFDGSDSVFVFQKGKSLYSSLSSTKNRVHHSATGFSLKKP